MLKNKKSQWLVYFLITVSLIIPLASNASVYSGKIYLQVESKGEAWYVYPVNDNKYYLGKPDDAFNIMRQLGLGITNDNLKQIPIGLLESTSLDSDSDGLSDDMERAIGTDPTNPDSDGDDYADRTEIMSWKNPLGAGNLPLNQTLINRFKGRIFLQVENLGEAWYLNPVDSKRYFLGKPADAFNAMRLLGIGITNANLAKITTQYSLTTKEVAEYYRLRMPSILSVSDEKYFDVNDKDLEYYLGMPIRHKLSLSSNNNGGQIKIYVLKPSEDKSLGALAQTVAYAQKSSMENFYVGAKPGQKQKFKYDSEYKDGTIIYNKGAKIFADIMVNTKQFVHISALVPDEANVTEYDRIVNSIIKNLILIY